MDKKQLKRPFFNYFFKVTDSILLSSDPEAMSTTLTTIKENLEAGDVVCVFQNPALTSDDKIDPFKFELDFLLKQLSVPIIPVTLKELSKNNITIENSKKCTMQIPPFRTKIEVIIGEAINAKKTSSDEVY